MNTADFMIQGRVNTASIIESHPAAALDGNAGGLPKLIINPENVTINGFRVFKPYVANIAMDIKYKGMTVNERLYVSGLMNAFDKAVEERNVERAREILEQVELTEGNIRSILEHFGLMTQKD